MQGALILLQRRPATKVVVFQWPQGVLPINRRPLRQRPRVRTILVLVPVSSMKTSLLASRPGWSAFHFCRACATSGRSCSAACSVFFEADPMPLEEPADRSLGRDQSKALANPLFKLLQGQIGFFRHKLQQPVRMRLQRRAALATARPRADAAGFIMQFYPAHRRRCAHPIMPSRLPPRRARRNFGHNAAAKIVRIRALSHLCLRIRWANRFTTAQPRESPDALAIVSARLEDPDVVFVDYL